MSKERITLREARDLALQIQRDTDEGLAIERAEEARRLEDPRITEFEVENARLSAALRTIAEWPFDIRGDCVADARKLAQAALAPKPAESEVKNDS
jgi:hypothetical protein